MQNKLPRIGARYKRKNSDKVISVTDISGMYAIFDSNELCSKATYLRDFFNDFEELPEEAISKMETTEKPVVDNLSIAETVKSVDLTKSEPEYLCENNHELPKDDLFSACKKCEKPEQKLPKKRIYRDTFSGYEVELIGVNECLKLWQEKLDEVNSAINEKESSAVDKALEELKEELKKTRMNYASPYNVRVKAENLINALEEEKKNQSVRANPAPLTDREKISQNQDKNEENLTNGKGILPSGKSIWKDVSELPEDFGLGDDHFLCKWKRHGDDTIAIADHFEFDKKTFNHGDFCGVDFACTLTDFITDYESEKKARVELEKRIEVLEAKLK